MTKVLTSGQEQVDQYLKEHQIPDLLEERDVKKIFLRMVEDYLLGKIGTKALNILIIETYWKRFMDKGKILMDRELDSAISDAEEIEHHVMKAKQDELLGRNSESCEHYAVVRKAEEFLREYLKKNRSD